MDALEKRLSRSMSDPHGISDDRMEGWRNRCPKDGIEARFVLRGMLLANNVVDICAWRDEFGLDSGTFNFCPNGKGSPKRFMDRSGFWNCICNLGFSVTFQRY